MSYKALILLTLALAGCTQHQRNDSIEYWKWYSQQVIERVINHKVAMPDSISDLYLQTFSNSKLMNSQFKIIYCVNLDCSVCHTKFNYWKNFKLELEEKYNIDIPILAVVSANSWNNNVEDYVNSTWGDEWIYDQDEDFAFLNNLEDDRFQAIFVDKNDTIRLVGNPVHNPALKELYEKAICKYIE